MSATCRRTASRSGTNGRTRSGDLGPVYGKQWRSWEKPDGGTIDQIRWVLDEIRRNPDSRRLIVIGLEPGRSRQDGARALPLPVPVLRGGRPALLPALPALGGRLPRRAVQHRVLCAPHPHDGPGHGPSAGRFRAHLRRRASLPEPPRAGPPAAHPRAAAAAAAAAQPGGALRCSTSPSTTSPSRTTSRIRPSGRRSPSELSPDMNRREVVESARSDPGAANPAP